MTVLSLNYPNYQQQIAYDSNGNASAAAAASVSSDGSAAASASAGTAGLLNSFNDLDKAANPATNTQQNQQPQNIMEFMMQFLQAMMQMLAQLLGKDPNNAGQAQQNPISNPKQQGQIQNPPSTIMNQQSDALQPTKTPIQNQQFPGTFASNPASASASASSAPASDANWEKTLADKGISQKEIELAKGKNLQELDGKGNPKYMLAKGADGKNHIFEKYMDCGTMLDYRIIGTTHGGANKFIVHKPEKNREAAAQSYGKGTSSSAAASASSSSLTYNVKTGDLTYSTASAAAAAASSSGNNIPIENQGGGHPHSPLILDSNKDGKVSAEQGKGVDLDGDGKADGAATGGDKMLAMGDINGNGKIDGTEVFGDKTVDPFTGKELKANNGFEALKDVAKSAEKHTGIKCMDDEGNVDLKKLKMALEMSGKGSLGMISDNNVTKLEGLGDAAKINVNQYINQQQTGDVQHNQIGSYQTDTGQTHRVDDVWFKLS
ncbi:MAG: hypothetical protein AB1782_05970 [Cyanobacteriota bacterium]